jgi:hypothetical protein
MAEWQNLQYHFKLKQENIEEFYLLRYNAVQLKVNQRLEEHFASRLLATYFHSCFLLGLFFNPEDGCDVSPRHRLTYSGLHGVIYQKTELFVTTAVRISYPAREYWYVCLSKTLYYIP